MEDGIVGSSEIAPEKIDKDLAGRHGAGVVADKN